MSSSLDTSSSSSLVVSILSSHATLSLEQRREATRELLALLGSDNKGAGGNSLKDDDDDARLQAVIALKTLGRNPQGTEDIASEGGLKTLLALAEFEAPDRGAALKSELTPIAAEATRCLANVCLLQEPARLRLASMPGIPEAILQAGQPSVPLSTRFLASRLLFLISVSGGEVVRRLVEELDIARYLSARLLDHLPSLCASPPSSSNVDPELKLYTDITIENLKTAFNVTLFYPRIVKEHQSNTLSPNPNNHNGESRKSFSGSSSSRSRSPSPSNGRPGSPNTEKGSPKTKKEKLKGMFSRKPKEEKGRAAMYDDTIDVLKPWGFEDVVSSLVQLALCLPFGQGYSLGPFGVCKHVITSLLNYEFSIYSSIIYAPLSPESAPSIPSLPTTSSRSLAPPSLPPFPARLLAMLDAVCRTYIPYGPDDEDALEKALEAPEPLDECLSFLLLLLAKCVSEDDRGDTRRAMKQCLLADDIDRSVGLERRNDLTGRLVRLLSSTYLSSSNEAAGKFLFSLCEQDPSAFAGTLGYGNASGFLQNIGMLVPPSSVPGPSSASSSSSDPSAPTPSINPITGAINPPSDPNEPQMSDEEKEREAEKLFVLFERLNKNGAISVENPIRQAQQSGKFSEVEEDEGKIMAEEDEEEEREASEEMRKYKERKAKK